MRNEEMIQRVRPWLKTLASRLDAARIC